MAWVEGALSRFHEPLVLPWVLGNNEGERAYAMGKDTYMYIPAFERSDDVDEFDENSFVCWTLFMYWVERTSLPRFAPVRVLASDVVDVVRLRAVAAK